MNTFVLILAVSIIAVLLYKAIEMAVGEYRENKRKWWLK